MVNILSLYNYRFRIPLLVCTEEYATVTTKSEMYSTIPARPYLCKLCRQPISCMTYVEAGQLYVRTLLLIVILHAVRWRVCIKSLHARMKKNNSRCFL